MLLNIIIAINTSNKISFWQFNRKICKTHHIFSVRTLLIMTKQIFKSPGSRDIFGNCSFKFFNREENEDLGTFGQWRSQHTIALSILSSVVSITLLKKRSYLLSASSIGSCVGLVSLKAMLFEKWLPLISEFCWILFLKIKNLN